MKIQAFLVWAAPSLPWRQQPTGMHSHAERGNEKGLERAFSKGFNLKLTPMTAGAPLQIVWFIYVKTAVKQADLAEEIGGQSVVSDILNGKREINARQAKLLAARFGVSPAAFL